MRRALPAQERQMVSLFIFFDQMGPGEFSPSGALDVRPHPRIGISTVTYLFDASILRRDSLGSEQPIAPGDVNWITTGRGIVRSERTDPALRTYTNHLFGIQSWAALPKGAEEAAPGFVHHPAASLPLVEDGGAAAADCRRGLVPDLTCRGLLAAVPRRRRPEPRWRPAAAGRARGARGRYAGRRDQGRGGRSVIDAYAFRMMRWASKLLSSGQAAFPNVRALHDRLAADPAVQKVLAREARR
jgi:hypothetical protein